VTKRPTHRSAPGIALVGALLLLTANAVWACTAQPRIFSLGPQVGPVGLEITLEGQAVPGAPVEVRWNSLQGVKIGEGVADFSGNFAVPARIPQAEPGIYFILVKAANAGVFRDSFEVTAERAVASDNRPADRAASSADLWSAFSTDSPAVESRGAQTADADSGSQAILGAALLAAGAAALAFGLVADRRRRHAGRRTI
jgi:hypothetical protein